MRSQTIVASTIAALLSVRPRLNNQVEDVPKVDAQIDVLQNGLHREHIDDRIKSATAGSLWHADQPHHLEVQAAAEVAVEWLHDGTTSLNDDFAAYWEQHAQPDPNAKPAAEETETKPPGNGDASSGANTGATATDGASKAEQTPGNTGTATVQA